ncbi:MAG: hypothetical protein AAFV69_09610 [Pseudomonadota bacterium]
MTIPTGPPGGDPRIATKAELDHKKASRLAPQAGMHLSPPGIDATSLRRQLQTQHEARIKHLEDRLSAAGRQIRTGLAKGLVAGRAKSEFSHSR